MTNGTATSLVEKKMHMQLRIATFSLVAKGFHVGNVLFGKKEDRFEIKYRNQNARCYILHRLTKLPIVLNVLITLFAILLQLHFTLKVLSL